MCIEDLLQLACVMALVTSKGNVRLAHIVTRMLSTAAADAKTHEEKRSAGLKKLEAELHDRAKELGKQAKLVGSCTVIAVVAVQINHSSSKVC